MNPEQVFKVYESPRLKKPSLIAAWIEDAGKLGPQVIDFLVQKLDCREFGEILPEGFFPMSGVTVEDDVTQFPMSKFFVSDEHNLIIFLSNTPRTDWYRFLNTVLDITHNECGVKEIYALGAMVSSAAHTMPRLILSVVNSPQMKDILNPYGIISDMEYETPPGQKPTINSYLVWLAWKRGLPGASLWIPVSYYLIPAEDPRACKRYVDFFDRRFNLGIDTQELDDRMAEQNAKIARLFKENPAVEGFVRRLEINQPLEPEESERLAREMGEYLNRP